MRNANITLYNINPVGVSESLERTDFYQAFLKGVGRVTDVQPGDLGVQVLAIQSGGLATESNSDVNGMIRKCLADVDSWYEIGFDPTPADKPNQYHHLDVKVGQRDLVVRTRDGYYANPTTLEPRH
jgi:VWFA-related protein